MCYTAITQSSRVLAAARVMGGGKWLAPCMITLVSIWFINFHLVKYYYVVLWYPSRPRHAPGSTTVQRPSGGTSSSLPLRRHCCSGSCSDCALAAAVLSGSSSGESSSTSTPQPRSFRWMASCVKTLLESASHGVPHA